MTTTAWFTSRTASNGRPQVTMFDTDGSSAREQEAMNKIRDTFEVGARAAREWAAR